MPIKVTTESFINKSKEKFGKRFTYENTVYEHNKKKVRINCIKHGEFLVTPNNHLFATTHGGCEKCGMENTQKDNIKRNLLEKNKFTNICNNIFENKYDYSKTEYINMNKKIIVTCPIHGDFEILPGKHKYNFQGCPECSKYENMSRPEKYFQNNIKIESIFNFKIDTDEYLKSRPFDFYIPKFNLILELHGQQHYKKK